MPDPDVIKRSVTAADYAETPQGGAFFLAVGSWNRRGHLRPDLIGLGLRDSDMETIATIDHEAIWAGAVSIAITKVSSLAWEVQGEIPLRVKRAQELLLQADAGRGWVSFISKILQDFLLCSNGAFIEVVRATNSINSQIIGLIPLDSMRCTRTGDPEIPVAYQDLKGRIHNLRAEDVIEFADMPSSRASLFGSGKCAAARAYKSIYELANIQDYVSDKVSGRRPLAVHLINGLNDIQLRSVLQTAQSEADARGAIAYMGAIMATIPADVTASVATVPLADFPDNFNRRDELDIAVISYANNLGLDVQDLQPLTGRALGTGAQSQVLDEKAKGKGLAAFRQQFVHSINTWVLPDMTTMVFIEKDWRDKKLNAEYNQAVEGYVSDSVEKGIISAPQGLQVLVDENVYPKEILPVDETPDTTLADTEKPETEAPEEEEPPEEEPEGEEEEAVDIVKAIKARLAPLKVEQAVPEKAEASQGPEFKETSQSDGVEEQDDRIIVAIPTGLLRHKEQPPNIVVNVPAPVVNVQVPTVNIPAPVVNVAPAPAPVVNVAAPVVNMPEIKIPEIRIPEIKVPEKKGKFAVHRDNFGNVLGIEEE